MKEESQEENIEVVIDEGVLIIKFARPDKKNALTHAMYSESVRVITEAEKNSDVRVILLTGTKEFFTAGNDLKDFLDGPLADGKQPVVDFLMTLVHASKPIVASVNGFAVGIGTTMLFHCDLVYAAENASFKMPFADLALCPEGGSSLLLPRRIGHQLAAELLFFGDAIDAKRAYEIGLVNAIFPVESCFTETLKRAKILVRKPPESIRNSKQLLKQWEKEILVEHMKSEMVLFAERLQSEEAAEAMAAILEKRKPDFSRF